MSSSHPYWAYGPDASGSPGDPDEFVKAVDEGRRAFALEMAVKSFASSAGEVGAMEMTTRARVFAMYLKDGSE